MLFLNHYPLLPLTRSSLNSCEVGTRVPMEVGDGADLEKGKVLHGAQGLVNSRDRTSVVPLPTSLPYTSPAEY